MTPACHILSLPCGNMQGIEMNHSTGEMCNCRGRVALRAAAQRFQLGCRLIWFTYSNQSGSLPGDQAWSLTVETCKPDTQTKQGDNWISMAGSQRVLG